MKTTTAARQVVSEESVLTWLCESDGNLPGEFLRLQGVDPGELVSLGWLSESAGRWTDCYVAGPRLQPQPHH